MLEHDGSRESVVRKKSVHISAPQSMGLMAPRPPDPMIPHPPATTTYSPFPLPGIPPSPPITTSTSSSEISSGVEGMKLTVDTADTTVEREDKQIMAHTTDGDKEDEYELVHEGSYLRAMLDADTPIETMATYAASKNKLHGADEVYSRIMSLQDGDSDDEEDEN